MCTVVGSKNEWLVKDGTATVAIDLCVLLSGTS